MSRTFDAWHLPGLETDGLEIATYELGELSVRAPVLNTAHLNAVISHTIAARTRELIAMKTAAIVSAIDAAATRIADAEAPEGKAARELLPAVTGYSSAVIDDVLAHMTRDWSAASLNTLLQAELGEATRLETTTEDSIGGRAVITRGPRFAFHVFSGNVPGVAVTSLVRALLVRAASLGKTAAGEPVLPVLFARALAATSPALAECVAVTYWRGGHTALEAAAVGAADVAIIYGGAEAVRSIATHAGPNTRVLVHGPKLSLGVVGRDAQLDVAVAIAHATAAYDQQGCVSPHVVYVEQGGNLQPKQLAGAIADALSALQQSQPRRKLSHAEALAIRNARAQAEFRGIASGESEVFGSEDTSFTVIYDDDPALAASCLNRTLYVKPIASLQTLPELLAPHRTLLQSVAIAGVADEQARSLAFALTDSGVTRITTFEALPWPRMWWHHDGRGPLQELLFWHDLER